MNDYFLSVTVICFIIAVIEMVLPSGKLKDSSKIVFTLIIMTCIIAPVINIDFDNLLECLDYEIAKTDEVFLLRYDELVCHYLEEQYVQTLLDNQLVCEQLKVTMTDGEIEKISIKLSNLVIKNQDEHIDSNVIINYIAQVLNQDKELIVLYD